MARPKAANTAGVRASALFARNGPRFDLGQVLPGRALVPPQNRGSWSCRNGSNVANGLQALVR
jgi:hypothetical protein